MPEEEKEITRQPKSATEQVLKALSALETATSVEIAEETELPVTSVSSALSKLHKALPNLLERDATKRPYVWRKTSGNASWEEIYMDYLRRRSAPILEEKTVDDPEKGVGPAEPLKIVVEVTGSVAINVSWARKAS